MKNYLCTDGKAFQVTLWLLQVDYSLFVSGCSPSRGTIFLSKFPRDSILLKQLGGGNSFSLEKKN